MSNPYPSSQKTLTLEKNGQTVNLLKKSEINLLVVHVGHLVQLKLCLIDFVSLLVKQNKPESPQRIYLHAVDSFVVSDVMEVIPQVLGASSKEKVWLLVMNITTTTGVGHTVSLPVNIIQRDPFNHAEKVNPPLNV